MGIISYIHLLLENSRIDNSDQKREFRICCGVELILLLLGLYHLREPLFSHMID
jgi:hypothetical protein